MKRISDVALYALLKELLVVSGVFTDVDGGRTRILLLHTKMRYLVIAYAVFLNHLIIH